jgi:predicted aspartyl protease
VARINFDPKSNVIVVDAEVFDAEGKDVESLRMILDTGSTFTIISWSILSSIGYDPVVSRKRVKINHGWWYCYGSHNYCETISFTRGEH